MKELAEKWSNSVALIRMPVHHGGRWGTGVASSGFIYRTKPQGHTFLLTSYQHKSIGSTGLVFFPGTGQCVLGECVGGSRAVNLMIMRIPQVPVELRPALPIRRDESKVLAAFDSLFAFDFSNFEVAMSPAPILRRGHVVRPRHRWGVLADFGRSCESAGGPVFDEAGEVVGIIDSRTDPSGELFIPFNPGVLRHLKMSEESHVPQASFGAYLHPFDSFVAAVHSINEASAEVKGVVRNSVAHQIGLGLGDAVHYLLTDEQEMISGCHLAWPESGDGRALTLEPNQRVTLVFTRAGTSEVFREEFDLETPGDNCARALADRELLGLITEIEPEIYHVPAQNGFKFRFSGMRVLNPGRFAMPSPEEGGGRIALPFRPGQTPTPATEQDFLQSGDLILGGAWHGPTGHYSKSISYFADAGALADYIYFQPLNRHKALWIVRGENHETREVLLPPAVFQNMGGFFVQR